MRILTIFIGTVLVLMGTSAFLKGTYVLLTLEKQATHFSESFVQLSGVKIGSPELIQYKENTRKEFLKSGIINLLLGALFILPGIIIILRKTKRGQLE